MRLLFFDDYKMGVMKDGQIVEVSSAIPNHDILPPNTQMERVIADFGPLRVSVRSYGPEKLERWAPPGTKKE